MSEKRQLAVNLIAQIVSFAVSVGISFFLTPFIVEHVGKESYGFVGLANNFVSYANIIVTALNSMASRYITISIHREDYDSASKYFSSVIISNLLMVTVLSIPATYVVCYLEKLVDMPSELINDIKLLWMFIFIAALLHILGIVFNCATYVKNRLDLQSLRSIESNFLKALVIILLYLIFEPHVYYIGIATLSYSLYCIIANIYYTKKLLPEIKVKKKYFDWQKIKELLSSGIWNSVGRISSILTDGLDLLIVNLFVNSVAMGEISIAKTIPSMILSVFGVLSGVFMPQLNISYAKGDMESIKKQLISSIKLLGMFSCIPVACLYAYGDLFFELWVPEENAKLLQGLAIVSALEFPFVLPLEPIWNVFTVTNKIKYSTLYLMANSVIGIIITFILLLLTENLYMRMFIVVGVSSLLAIVRAWTFMPLYSAKCLEIKKTVFYKPILKNSIALCLVTVLSFILRKIVIINTWIELIGVCCLTGIIAFGINYYILLSSSEREWIMKLYRRKR